MRFAVGVMSVLLCLSGTGWAQDQATGERGTPWNWLAPKKSPAPHKPSANQKSPESTAGGGPYVLRQTSCNIPFTVDSANGSPVELQLYVSQDRGATWQLYAKAAPSDRHFPFRAAADGEYWFALRSVEQSAHPGDTEKLVPGLKVVFDTREPEMRFEASMNESGEVSAAWVIRDATLVPGSLKVEYQTSAQGPWLQAPISSGAVGSNGALIGDRKWLIEQADRGVLLRAEVTDRAGNKTVISRRLLPRGESGQVADSFHARSRPDGTFPISQGGQSWPANNQLPPRIDAAPTAPELAELPPPKPSATGTPLAGGRETVRNPFIAAKQPVPEFEGPIRGQVPSYSSESAEQLPAPQGTPPVAEPPAAIASPNPSEPAPRPEPPVPASPPSVGQALNVPPGERPRMTQSRQFSLDYEIDPLGPTGVVKVELWGTSDGARTWQHWLDDVDRRSPIDVTVNQDGIYGFRIVVTGSNQLGGAPPQPGDPADLWVGIDTSQPAVRLTSALYGDGAYAGQLDIRWQATDTWFTDRPITLQFSEFPQGPWSTIAAGLPNSGQYYWKVDPRIPRHIYLRIEARDEAGNLGEHQLAEPLSTAGLVPKGRIRGLHIGPSTSTDDRSAARNPVTR